MALCTFNLRAVRGAVETGGLLGFAGHCSSSRFRERFCLEGIKWSLISYSDPSVCTHVHITERDIQIDRQTETERNTETEIKKKTNSDLYSHPLLLAPALPVS